MNDRELVGKAVQGDDDAFAILVKRYLRYIHTVAYQVVLHEEDARDVTQEVLYRLSRNLSQYQEVGSFRTWLAKITVHLAIDYQRKRSHREQATEPKIIIQLAQDKIDAAVPDPRENLEHRFLLRKVEHAMRHLSRQQRAILVLKLKEGMSTQEVAQALSISTEQVRVQLYRALKKIRKIVVEPNSGVR